MEACEKSMKELLNLLANIWAVSKNKRLIILFMGFSIVVCIFIFKEIDVKQEDSVVQVESSGMKEKSKSTILQPVDANENRIMQDPFAVPSSFHEKEEVQIASESKRSVKREKILPSVKATEMPILTGIIGSGNQFIAILKYGEASKQCLLEDSIGPYRVVGIDEKNVIVNGPNGAITLTVGR